MRLFIVSSKYYSPLLKADNDFITKLRERSFPRFETSSVRICSARRFEIIYGFRHLISRLRARPSRHQQPQQDACQRACADSGKNEQSNRAAMLIV